MKLAGQVKRGPALPALTLPHLWGMAAMAAVFIACGMSSIALGDFWWHLKAGEIITTTGRIPAADTFSFVAAGTPYVYQQWLGEVYLYQMFRLGGLELVMLANTLVMTASAALVLASAWEASGNLRIAALCTMAGMLVGLPNRDVRPQTLGFLLFALFYLLLTRYRRGKSAPLWVLPPLAAVWANVHGSALLGFGLGALIVAAEALKTWPGLNAAGALPRRKLVRLGAAVAAMAPAMLINPWGRGLFDAWLAIQRNPMIQSSVTEWFAPSFRDAAGAAILLALLACTAIFLLSPKAADLADAILFIAFAALALEAERNAIWFGIVAAPIAARQIVAAAGQWRGLKGRAADHVSEKRNGAAATSRARSAMLANYLFAALMLAAALLALPWVKQKALPAGQWSGLIDGETPVAAVRFIAERFPTERFFHSDTYGGYMIWAASGSPRVFTDGRMELYTAEVIQDYMQISMALGWEERLAKYGIRHILLPKRPPRDFQRPLLAALARAPDWRVVYEDEIAIVYTKGS